MKEKHTPGQWYESKTGNHQGLVISEDNGQNIAITYDKKDTRLIAAAPELLEVCKMAENWFSECSGGPDTGIDGILVDLRMAIAKAEGEL